MLIKKFIFENEDDVNELPDYKKLMRLVKKKLDPSQVEFYNSEGEDFSDNIKINHDGLMFTFDGLQEYLAFFFPDDFSKEENPSEYDVAGYYEMMYEKRSNWYSEFSDRYDQDWEEGYIVGSFKERHLELLTEITKFTSPNLYSKLSKLKSDNLESDMNGLISSFLETIDLKDDIVESYIYSSIDAVEDSVPKGISDNYCDCLSRLGIERYSEKYCFWKYEMTWGSCLLLFASFGSPDDNLLDLLFNAIEQTRISHLGEYYELQDNFWDNDKFEESWNTGLTKILEQKLEDIKENPENYDKNYFNVVDKVMTLGGTDVFIDTKDGKYQIKIHSIEPDTSLIRYIITRKGEWRAKQGKTDIDGLMSLFYNEKLFDIMEHKEKFSILRNKTFL